MAEMVEIDKAVLESLGRLKTLHDTLYNDPEVGHSFKEILKKKFPKARIPELDAIEQAPVVKEFREFKKEVGDFMEGMKKAGSDWSRSEALEKARSTFNLTDEGMDRLKKVMEERKISDPEIAAGYVVATAPKPAEPSGLGSTRWDLLRASNKEDEAELKFLLDDPDAWLEEQIPKILSQNRNPVRMGA